MRIRVGTAEVGGAVWLTLPVIFHRPLPEGEIRSVSAFREIIAGRERWKVVFSMRCAAPPVTKNKAKIAIDIGWRLMPGGVRVASWADSRGRFGELAISVGDLAQFERLDGIQAAIKLHFNEIVGKLKMWLATTTLPESLREQFQYIGQWKSPGRLVRALRLWKENRFTGDEAMWEEVVLWLYGAKEKSEWNGHQHLYNWQENLRDQLLRKRREQYRIFAKSLTGYGSIGLEGFHLPDVVDTPEVESAKQSLAGPNYRRTKAAISELRSAVENVCRREGIELFKVNPANTSKLCWYCGSREKVDGFTILHTCSRCARTWDRDQNAARNLLRRMVTDRMEKTAVA